VDTTLEIYITPVSRQNLRIGGPIFISTSVHALLLLLLATLAQQLALKPVAPPIKVLEINVMGPEDVALRGRSNDYSAGAARDKMLLAQQARDMLKATQGNVNRISRSIAQSEQTTAAKIPVLTAKGPLFKSARSYLGAGAGREKIYVSASIIKPRQVDLSSEKGGKGGGLVGVTGAAIDLNAKRGASGAPSGTSKFLQYGEGSADGAAFLSKRGKSVIDNSFEMSDDPILRSRKTAIKLDAPSDDFFSISGPLKGRKILKMKMPRYPRWAEEQGLEARIALRITVTARGRVKPDILIEQTSGFPEFDDLVLDAVRKMIYAPLPFESGNSDQWGIAAFNFKLKKGAPN